MNSDTKNLHMPAKWNYYIYNTLYIIDFIDIAFEKYISRCPET